MVTLADVARRAGVSVATASRVLHGSRGVRKQSKEQVEAAAAELGYLRNEAARATVTGRMDVIGLVVHDVADPYFASIARGVLGAADENGHSVMLASSGWRPHGEAEHMRRFSQLRARGVILAGSRLSNRQSDKALSAEISRYVDGGGSVVAIGQKVADVETIVIPNAEAGRALGKELLAAGYQRLVVLCGPSSVRTSADRVRGLRSALRSTGAQVEVCEVPFSRHGAHAGVLRLKGSLHRFDCLVAVSDDMAVGAVAELRELGVRVPEDIGVAGIGDVEQLRDFHPRLTTVHLGLDEVGAHALEICVDGPAAVAETKRRVACYVVRGASTRQPAG